MAVTEFTDLTKRSARVNSDEIVVQPTGNNPPQRIEVDTLLDDLATRAQAHLGVLELSVNSDQAVFDTLVANIAAGLVNAGDKWYISNPGAASYYGKIVRYNGVALNRSAVDHNFDKYFEVITELPSDTKFTPADETKLDGIAEGAEVNVNADWKETSPTDDSFIQNKPTDAQIGDAAFSNPPSDLSDAEKTAVQTAIGALIGGRTETISFNNNTTNLKPTDSARAITPKSTDPIDVVVGSGDARILSSVAGNNFSVAPGLYLIEIDSDVTGTGSNSGIQFNIKNASSSAIVKATGGIFISQADLHVAEAMVLWLSASMSLNVEYRALRQNIGSVSDPVISFTLLSGGADADSNVAIHPQISNFALRTGELSPVAGSIASDVYGVAWSIANSDHVGAARILGFKGAFGDGTGAVLLSTIPQGSYAHAQADVTIPNGVSLADNETYTMRLQVYETGIANPALTDAPRAYQDLVIRAHAAASANYHWGRVPYEADDADANATIARIVFATHDIRTFDTLPNQLTVSLPDDSTYYQMYFFMKSDQAQATGFTLNSLPATNSFYPVASVTVSSVTYSVFLQRPGSRLTHDSNDGDTYGVNS